MRNPTNHVLLFGLNLTSLHCRLPRVDCTRDSPPVVPIITLAEERAVEAARRAAAAKAARERQAADEALCRWHRSRRQELIPNTLKCTVCPKEHTSDIPFAAIRDNAGNRALPRTLPPLGTHE